MLKNLLFQFYMGGRYVLGNKKGQAIAEYGLIIALIALVCITALSGLGTAIAEKLNDIVTAISPPEGE